MLDRPERAVIKYISKIDTDFVSANIFEYQKHIFHRLTVPEEIAAQKIRGAEGEAETLRQKDRILTMLRKERHYAVRRRCNSLSPTGLKGNLSGYTTEAQNSHQGEVCAFLSVQKITRIFVSKATPNQKIIYQNRRKIYERTQTYSAVRRPRCGGGGYGGLRRMGDAYTVPHRHSSRAPVHPPRVRAL